MAQERSNEEVTQSLPEGLGLEWMSFIQQQVQAVFQTAILHIVQKISECSIGRPDPISPSGLTRVNNHTRSTSEGRNSEDFEGRESKVATPDKFAGKKGGEVYKWFAQLRLVFHGKPRAYQCDEDKVAYTLSYMSGAVQN